MFQPFRGGDSSGVQWHEVVGLATSASAYHVGKERPTTSSPEKVFSDSILDQNELLEAPSLRLKGSTRMEVRVGRRTPGLEAESAREPVAKRPKLDEGQTTSACTHGKVMPRQHSNPELIARVHTHSVVVRHEDAWNLDHQILRISAGRAAAAAGVHPYADIGDMFLEFLYQDMPEMLLEDAAMAGIEVISPFAERARLLAKSGAAHELEAAIHEATSALAVGGARAAKEAVVCLVAAAESTGKLTVDEAEQLRSTLELEINLEFGARHEDAAIEKYEARIGKKVYGQQHRVSVGMTRDGPSVALSTCFPTPHIGTRPEDDVNINLDGAKEASGDGSGTFRTTGHVNDVGVERFVTKAASGNSEERPLIRLAGFVDGIVDVPRGSSAPPVGDMEASRQGGCDSETLIVEVKHRMGCIKDPPNLYDVIQLCTYCRALGCTRGDLVQCLRVGGANSTNECVDEVLHIKRIDFSEGSPDRQGWDMHVLPGLYAVARAVYSARADLWFRLRLSRASTPGERAKIIGEICPHLDR